MMFTVVEWEAYYRLIPEKHPTGGEAQTCENCQQRLQAHNCLPLTDHP